MFHALFSCVVWVWEAWLDSIGACSHALTLLSWTVGEGRSTGRSGSNFLHALSLSSDLYLFILESKYLFYFYQ